MDATLIRTAYAAHGYRYFEGDYNLNLFGIRNNTRPGANAFDDVLGVAEGGRLHLWRGTTDPGLTYTGADGRARGVAVVVPGQYRGLWTIGQHPRAGGPTAHRALVQVGQVAVYRDADDDGQVDEGGIIEFGVFGINGHRAGKASTKVDGWSAGCQVWARQDDHTEMMRLADEQVRRGLGTTFTYTLLRLAEHPELAGLFGAVGVTL